MAYATADLAGFEDTVRSLCAGATLDEVPDTTIALVFYTTWVENKVNELQPTYDSLTVDEKFDMQSAGAMLMASRLSRYFCRNRLSQATNNKSSLVRNKNDWDKISRRLLAEAMAILVPADTTTARAPIILSPSAVDEVTGIRRGRIAPAGNDSNT